MMDYSVTYCHRCGAEMRLQTFEIDSYDRDNGAPVYRAGYVCPNRKFFISAHDKIMGLLYTAGSNSRFEPDWIVRY